MSSAFHDLHAPGRLLILPNAWDAASARLIEDCGAPAIATTSAGLAWARGYPDGNALPVATLAAAIAEITRVVRVPVSADVEGGYASEAAAVGETVARVIDAGAVGINLEDGQESPDLLCAKIEAARRAARYRAAGCDGIFVPRASKHDDVHTIVAEVAPLPLNLLAMPGLAAAAELRTWGVRRLSAGSAIAAAALGITRGLTTQFLEHGRSDALFNDPIEYGRMNALLSAAAIP